MITNLSTFELKCLSKKSLPFLCLAATTSLLTGCGDTSVWEMIAGKSATKVKEEGDKALKESIGSGIKWFTIIGGVIFLIFIFNYVKGYSRRKREEERDERMDKMMERQAQQQMMNNQNNNNIDAPKF